MLLFSTILSTTDSLGENQFFSLVEDWNNNQSHPENIIPDVHIYGEPDKTFGNAELWMRVIHRKAFNTISVRYEKNHDGAVWDTDYIFNYAEHKLSIQLSRSYIGGRVANGIFSTPHFITLLIDGGYIVDDGDLPVSRNPILINTDNLQVLVNAVNGNRSYTYPIVFISKTHANQDPVDVFKLAAKLKGVAHVLVQDDVASSLKLREMCNGKEEYWGDIGAYYPDGISHRCFRYCKSEGYDEELENEVIRSILQYTNSRVIPKLHTWQGVQDDIYRVATEEAVSEVDLFTDDYERQSKLIKELRDENQKLRKQIEKQQSELEQYEAELLSQGNRPILYMGLENDLYLGEIKDIVLRELNNMLRNLDADSRRYHIIKDIVDNNEYLHIAEKRAEELKKIMRGYVSLTPAIESELRNLGFRITTGKTHNKIKYCGDERYWAALSKSGSDWCGGDNAASEIIKKMM